MAKKKTLIASHDDKLRQALEFLLNNEPGAEISGSVNNTAGLIALTITLKPDLIFLDWDIPDKPSAELITALQTINPATKTIILSKSASESDARSAGADRCITKGSSPEVILENYRALFYGA
jgi:DNA-binding NarL/FixJ family response regulator